MNDAFGHPQSVVVLGGTSDIARNLVALLVADRGRSVVLAGRDRAALEQAAEDLRHSVARVRTVTFDASTLDDVDKTVMRCFEAAAEVVDLVIVAVGELGSQAVDETDPDRIARMMTVNLTWPAAALSAVAGQLRQQGHGRIVVLSSVAGFRIRRSNFVYGSAKAGLDGFALRTLRSPSWHRCLRAHRPTRLRSNQDDHPPITCTLRRRGFSGGIGTSCVASNAARRSSGRAPQVGVLCPSPAPWCSVPPLAGLTPQV